MDLPLSSNEEPIPEPITQVEEKPQKVVNLPEELPKLPSSIELKLAALPVGEKADFLLVEMETSLKPRPPQYKLFWDLRKVLLSLSKDVFFSQNPGFWDKFHALTQEARHLKTVLEEESAFAQEQIELAIDALEKEFLNPQINESSFDPELIRRISSLGDHLTLYLDLQAELNFLNTYATRVQALRKELTKLPLKHKPKTSLFDRLSKLGDQLFPRRRELIQSISDRFVEDVETFVKNAQPSQLSGKEIGRLKDYIRSIQSLAKILTLNTFAFNTTRQGLSTLWDSLKGLEKEKREETDKEREESKKLLDRLVEQLEKIVQDWTQGSKTLDESEKAIDQLMSEARRTRLDRFHVRDWREKAALLKKPIDDALQADQEKERQIEETRRHERQEKVSSFSAEVSYLLKNLSSLPLEDVESQYASLTERLSSLVLQKIERQEIERHLRSIKEAMRIKKEESLLALTLDDKLKLDALLEVLENRVVRRKEIKDHLEKLRKAKGNTGFDFEQALLLDSQIREERGALEEINQAILTLEKQINSIRRQE